MFCHDSFAQVAECRLALSVFWPVILVSNLSRRMVLVLRIVSF